VFQIDPFEFGESKEVFEERQYYDSDDEGVLKRKDLLKYEG